MPLDASTLIEFKVGMKYADFVRVAEKLIVNHWNEVGTFRPHVRLNPDHARYLAAEKAGNLHIITAWADDSIVGYLFMFIVKYARDQEKLVASEDIYYVIPEYRRHRVGLKLRKASEELARAFGCVFNVRLEKARRRNHRSPERDGYVLHELVYAKVLE